MVPASADWRDSNSGADAVGGQLEVVAGLRILGHFRGAFLILGAKFRIKPWQCLGLAIAFFRGGRPRRASKALKIKYGSGAVGPQTTATRVVLASMWLLESEVLLSPEKRSGGAGNRTLETAKTRVQPPSRTVARAWPGARKEKGADGSSLRKPLRGSQRHAPGRLALLGDPRGPFLLHAVEACCSEIWTGV